MRLACLGGGAARRAFKPGRTVIRRLSAGNTDGPTVPQERAAAASTSSTRAPTQQPQGTGLLWKWLDPSDHHLALSILGEGPLKPVPLSLLSVEPSAVMRKADVHTANMFLLGLAKARDTHLVEKAFTYRDRIQTHLKKDVPTLAPRDEMMRACGREVRRLLDPSSASSSVDVREEVRRWVARARGLADEVFLQEKGDEAHAEAAWRRNMSRALSSMIYVYCQARTPKEAVGLYDRMLERGIKPDGKSSAVMVKTLAAEGEPEEAVSLLERMQKEQAVEVEHYTGMYRTIIYAVAEQLQHTPPAAKATSLRAAAKRAVASMRASGEEVTRPVWHALLLAEAVTGRTKEVRWLMSEMEGHGLELTAAEYGLLVDAHGAAGMPGGLERALEEMRGRNIKPDHAFYSRLIAAYGRCGNVEGAKRAFAALDGADMLAGEHASRNHYTALMKALRQAGRQTEAWQLFEEYQKRYVPDNYMARVAIRVAAELGNVQLMEQTYQELTDSQGGDGAKADAKVLNSLMAGYAQAGHWDKAWEVFERLKSPSRVRPIDISSYNVMICALVRENRLEEARTLGQEAKERGLRFDVVTRRALLHTTKGLSRLQEELEEAAPTSSTSLTHTTLQPVVQAPVPQGGTGSAARTQLSNGRLILDLHGLSIAQAHAVLSYELRAVRELLKDPSIGLTKVVIISGFRQRLMPQGQVSSGNGESVLKAAVREYLETRGVRFYQPRNNPGAFIISVGAIQTLVAQMEMNESKLSLLRMATFRYMVVLGLLGLPFMVRTAGVGGSTLSVLTG